MQTTKTLGIKKFEDLNTSTITTMAYSNFNIDTKLLFHLLEVKKESDGKYETKRKIINSNKLQYNYGDIITISTKSCFRGILLRRPKKKNCSICNPDKNKHIKKSIVEVFEESESEIPVESQVTHTKTKNSKETTLSKKVKITKIMYKCSSCEKTYNPAEVKKINHFLNQITIVMSLGNDKTPINIKIFHNGKFTIVGCKNIDDVINALVTLFKDKITSLEKEYGVNIITFKNKDIVQKKIILDVVMRNFDFNLGFTLNRCALNNIMSDPKYDHVIKLSKFIPTGDTNVKIKMKSVVPTTITYDCLVFNSKLKEGFKIEKVNENPYHVTKKKTKEKLDTLIVFSSSATIFSGKYVDSMRTNYNIFIDIINKYKEDIKEK